MTISKLSIRLTRIVKRESLARAKKRINTSLRNYNQAGIKTNWMHQASSKL